MNPAVHGSITHLRPGDRGRHVVVGSHGGLYTATVAVSAEVASLICHDAGVGLESAGIKGLSLLEDAGIPAAAVDFRSARIGDANDMLVRGVISHVNAPGYACGVTPAMAAAEAFAIIQRAQQCLPLPGPRLSGKSGEFRRIIGIDLDRGDRSEVLAVDSASLVRPEDAGAIVVTGSHGGLPGGDEATAIKADVRCAVFNDAGVGIDKAGIGRLPVLDARGIAGLTVGAQSARIGEALSTYRTGIISHANRLARDLGAAAGRPLRDFLCDLVNLYFRKESL